jgi:hypothetical protein
VSRNGSRAPIGSAAVASRTTPSAFDATP